MKAQLFTLTIYLKRHKVELTFTFIHRNLYNSITAIASMDNLRVTQSFNDGSQLVSSKSISDLTKWPRVFACVIHQR
ncbi:hypothetical protein A9P91_25035 [Klebsiella quasipneumoniae subsp. similipneumoniae]|nr:hypothetical protein A9P91_25035 [Klebsiella quasipneumoniae subsp. similipneumoniae]